MVVSAVRLAVFCARCVCSTGDKVLVSHTQHIEAHFSCPTRASRHESLASAYDIMFDCEPIGKSRIALR